VTTTALWRERDFAYFWTGQAVSLTGSAVTQVALPLLAVVTLRAGPVGIGVLEASVWVPFLGLPLLAGAYVDRHRKRPVLVGCNAIRAVLLGTVAVLAWTHALTLPVLCVIAVASGACEVCFQIAELAYLPVLVGRDRLLHANSSVQAVGSTAELAGPGLAGVLVQAFGAATAIALDAVSYAVSVVTLAAIRRPEPPPVADTDRHVRRDIVEGLRFLWATVPVRTTAVQGMAFNAAWQAFNVAFVLYAVRDRHVGTGWWGAVLAVGGAASVLGAIVAPKTARWLGLGRGIAVASAVTIPPVLLQPAAEGPLWTVLVVWSVAQAVTGLGVGLVNVLVFTLRARFTPDELLGRVGASSQLLVFGALPLGALAGGVLAHAFGDRAAMWVTALWEVATIALLVPLWRLGPEPVERPEPAASRER
jgi:hypothetical protein